MPVGVVGGRGEIGRHLTEALARRGDDLRIVVRRGRSGRDEPTEAGVRPVEPGDVEGLRDALHGCETVVDLATDKRDEEGARSRVARNARNVDALLRACRLEGVRRIVHVSSVAVLPPRRTDRSVRRPFRMARTRDVYARSKIAAERSVRAAARSAGCPPGRDPFQRRVRRAGDLEVVIVRPGVVYGPGMMWSRMAVERARDTVVLLPAVDGHAGRCCLVHVADLVRMLLRLLADPAPLPLLVVAAHPEIVDWARFYRQHGEAIGAESAIEVWSDARLRRFARRSRRRRRDARARGEPEPVDTQGRPYLRPTRYERALYSSVVGFPSDQTGARLGFEYSTSFAAGCRSSFVP